jgi:acyl dehydratase
MAAPQNYQTANLPTHVGHDFGFTQPLLVDQARIDAFANCTGDKQWIHVDVERARATPLGTTIAHGLLLLSLIPVAQYELGVYPKDAASVLNYGMERVRFLEPVPADSALVLQVTIASVEPKGEGRFLVRCSNAALRPRNAGVHSTRVRQPSSLASRRCGSATRTTSSAS